MRTKLQYYWDTLKSNKCNSIHNQDTPRHEKSARYCLIWKVLDQMTHSVWSNKTATLLTIIAGRQIHTLHMLSVIHMDQSLDNVTFNIIVLTKCSKPTKLKQRVVYIIYVEDELLCPIKCIYAYLAQRSQIVAQDFSDFFITFGKPHHPTSKELRRKKKEAWKK